MTNATPELIQSERRIAFIHRVIVTDVDYPKEYSILVTDRRSIFIRQEKTRSSFVLRGETRYGTALVTDVEPKTLEDYRSIDLETLESDPANVSIPHEAVHSLVVTRGEPEFRLRDSFVWLTMKLQGHKFRVYDFEIISSVSGQEKRISFYLVPLGAYFKPKRAVQDRETILREYAMEALHAYQDVLPPRVIVQIQGNTLAS